MSRPKTIRCEDALFLMSRHLDGDISKEETWQIHNHSNSCPDCQVQMEEMAAIELELSACHKFLDSHSLDKQFNTQVMTALSEKEKDLSLAYSWRQYFKKINCFQISHAYPTLSGSSRHFGEYTDFLSGWSPITFSPRYFATFFYCRNSFQSSARRSAVEP